MSRTPTNDRLYAAALSEDDHAAAVEYMQEHGIASKSELVRLAMAKLLKLRKPGAMKRGRPFNEPEKQR
jgi:hypothetical protein